MKTMSVLLVVLLGLVGLSQATSILWVSDCITETSPHDQGFIDLLESEGYTVTRLTDPRVMDAAKAASVSASYDLVIVGRHGDSGQYASSGDEVAAWNGITIPLINQNAYLARDSRWRWQPSGNIETTSANLRALLPEDSVFNGVTLDENNELDYVDFGSVAVVATTTRGNEELVAIRSVTNAEHAVLARWTTGQEYYVGSGQFAAGPRMLFNSAQSGGSGDGMLNLTTPGTIMFLNAVYEMSGATYNRKPVVSAGTDRITNVNTEIQLDGTIFDPEGASLTITWSQIAGPGTATFADAGVEDPTVSFDVKGGYTLEIEVIDGEIVVTDTCTVHVIDPADNALLAHWDFENLPDPNVLFDVTGNGFDGIYYRKVEGTEPNVAAGHITGSAVAGDLASIQYWEIPTSYDETDPNLNDVATGITISAWVKAAGSPDYCCPMIVGNGVDGWRLQVNENRWNFAYQPGGIDLFGTYPPFDDAWHNVVAVYDGVNSKAMIYVDGVLNVEQDVTAGVLLSKGTTYPLVQVGGRGDDLNRVWTGQIDDIQIYNYPLDDTAIADLASEGDLLPLLTAGEDQEVQYKGVAVQLDATLLVDDGIPAPLALTWEVTTAPAGVELGDIVFDDNTIEDPLVTFPNVAGTYIFTLTGNDGAVEVSDDVNILILIPTCADVLNDGFGLASDLSGPDGEPDCYVNIYDLAAVAANWLSCNNPEDASCTWPY